MRAGEGLDGAALGAAAGLVSFVNGVAGSKAIGSVINLSSNQNGTVLCIDDPSVV